MKRMPALFIGHGSPMLALDHNEMTKTLTELGKRIITDYGRPKAIAVVSAHWYSRGSYVNAAQKPEQIYDMYGFPQALYEVSYPALGDPQTARRIHDLTGAVMTEDWGIDHGVWTLFVHMFPDASLPVVPLVSMGPFPLMISTPLEKNWPPCGRKALSSQEAETSSIT